MKSSVLERIPHLQRHKLEGVEVNLILPNGGSAPSWRVSTTASWMTSLWRIHTPAENGRLPGFPGRFNVVIDAWYVMWLLAGRHGLRGQRKNFLRHRKRPVPVYRDTIRLLQWPSNLWATDGTCTLRITLAARLRLLSWMTSSSTLRCLKSTYGGYVWCLTVYEKLVWSWVQRSVRRTSSLSEGSVM